MELLFDANKIFVPSNKYKAPDISCFIYKFSGNEGVKKTPKRYIAYFGMCQKIAYLLNGKKMQLGTLY